MGDYHTARPPLIRMSRWASNFYDSGILRVASQEVWGLMIFVPPSPGLFLLLLMFRNCEQPGAPGLLPPRSPGTEEEQPPSREILDQRDQAAWDRDDWNAILSYLTQHWLHFFLSRVLAEQRGSLQYFIPVNIQQTNKPFNFGPSLFGEYESLKTWLNILLMAKKVWL